MPMPPLPNPSQGQFLSVLDEGLAELRSKLVQALRNPPSAVFPTSDKDLLHFQWDAKDELPYVKVPPPSLPPAGVIKNISQQTQDSASDDEDEYKDDDLDKGAVAGDLSMQVHSGDRSLQIVQLKSVEEEIEIEERPASKENSGGWKPEHSAEKSPRTTIKTGAAYSQRGSVSTDPERGGRPSFTQIHHFKGLLYTSRLQFVNRGLTRLRRYQESIVMILICANSICMGWQLQYHAATGHQLEGSSLIDLAFCIAFVTDIVVRITIHGREEFFLGDERAWNLFDTAVVSIMVVEEFSRRLIGDDGDINGMQAVPALRILRLMRAIRVLRAVKLFRALDFFRSGRLLIMSIIRGCKMMVWIVITFLSMVYVLALIIAYGTLPHCVGDETTTASNHVSNALEYQDACFHFGTLWKSCVSLYQAMLGGIPWYVLYNALKVLDAQYVLFFTAFITFDFAILLNIISGVFVCQVIATTEVEKQHSYYDDQLKKRKMFMKDMVKNFHELDVNGNGALCKDELVAMFTHKQMSSLLASLELDLNAAGTLFDLLDADGSGHVKIDEFVVGCLKLQGKARSVDLERVSRDVQEIQTLLKNGQTRLKDAVPEKESPRRKPPEKESSAESQKSANVSKWQPSSSSNYSKVGMLKNNQKRVRIEQTEMRAMLVSELEDVVARIESSCLNENWTDSFSGEELTSKKVNLYHYNYHVISPITASTSVTLTGMLPRRYEEGDVLLQLCDGRVVGEASVLNDTITSEVHVALTKGQLFSRSSTVGQESNVTLNGHDCGIPESVVNTDSVSYKEVISSTPTRPDWFCTHWWGEPIVEFVACCRAHAAARKRDAYWVCAYANRQHDLGLDVGADPEESSFRRSMRVAEGVLLVLDQRSMPFYRIWCDFELYKTVCDPYKKLDIITFKGKPRLLTETPLPDEHDVEKTQREAKFPLHVLSKGAQLFLERGKATVEQDKTNILNSMGKDPRTGVVDDELMKLNVDRANRALRAYFALAAWPQALKQGVVRNFQFSKQDDILRLPDILAADDDRRFLQLSLSSIEEVDDTEIESIANALPHGLKDLHLSFENCYNISDIGVATLAERLNALPLQKLRIDFVSCRKLSDSAVHAMAMNLPSSLTDVRLDFAFCHLITKAGVQVLATELPKNVKNFTGTFRGTKFDEDVDSVKKLRKLKTERLVRSGSG